MIKAGADVRIDLQTDWYTKRSVGEVELVIRGTHSYKPSADNFCAYWLLYPRRGKIKPDIADANHVFVASTSFSQTVSTSISSKGVSPLHQCTDMNYLHDINTANEFFDDADKRVVFVGLGTERRKRNGAAMTAIQAGYDVSVWGKEWQNLPDGFWKGEYVPNERLGMLYASAGVVLNDHLPEMKVNGFVNNRIYDVLASGSPLITDKVTEIPDEFLPFVYLYDDVTSMKDCLDKALNEGPDMKKRRLEFAMYIQEHHSFDARAKEIVESLNKLVPEWSKKRNKPNG